ncbi:hypothetical protein [Methylobacterium nigriterrae]|uniref:hypothetical protein n=1 Tax=Methylobacterium nigriterrae TaxID=3127512 RepID=UPI00301351DB
MGYGRASEGIETSSTLPRRNPGAALRGGRILVAVSVLLPVAILVLASWHNRGDVLREADTRVERTVRVLHEHAVKVFETQKLIIDRVNGRLRYLNWDSEADRLDLHRFLAELQRDYGQVATLDPPPFLWTRRLRCPALLGLLRRTVPEG